MRSYVQYHILNFDHVLAHAVSNLDSQIKILDLLHYFLAFPLPVCERSLIRAHYPYIHNMAHLLFNECFQMINLYIVIYEPFSVDWSNIIINTYVALHVFCIVTLKT